MMVKIKANLFFRQILDMTYRGENSIFIAKVFIYSFSL